MSSGRQSVSRSALVPHAAERMYELVRDVDSYVEFLPWCAGSAVLEENENEQLARIDVDLKIQKVSFTTRNRLVPGRALHLELVDGPFRSLQGQWQFEALDEAASRVAFELQYEFESRMLSTMLGGAFRRIVDSQVQAFVKRASELDAGSS